MTLAGMSDGISMFDSNLRLVQWNEQFADLDGVPRQALRVNMPLEDILRLQVAAGEFGPVEVEPEVARLMAMMHAETWPEVFVRLRPQRAGARDAAHPPAGRRLGYPV